MDTSREGEMQHISIPAPARGRTGVATATSDWSHYFNSRPREGANASAMTFKLSPRISIPAPARGRTSRAFRPFAITINFNSRPREGANVVDSEGISVSIISIPAPARGRTGRGEIMNLPNGFQFPPPRGGEQQNCTK